MDLYQKGYFIWEALQAEKERLGTVNPQYSYFERLRLNALTDGALRERLFQHITNTGGFSGL
jgi:hypothetical protein